MANHVPMAALAPPKKPARRNSFMPTEAPTLSVHYKCPVCGWNVVVDTYSGPPVCKGNGEQGEHGVHQAWMVALEVVVEEPPDPLADIAAMTGGWHRPSDERSK